MRHFYIIGGLLAALWLTVGGASAAPTLPASTSSSLATSNGMLVGASTNFFDANSAALTGALQRVGFSAAGGVNTAGVNSLVDSNLASRVALVQLQNGNGAMLISNVNWSALLNVPAFQPASGVLSNVALGNASGLASNLSGTALVADSVNSNKLDAATRYLLGTGGSGSNLIEGLDATLDAGAWTNTALLRRGEYIDLATDGVADLSRYRYFKVIATNHVALTFTNFAKEACTILVQQNGTGGWTNRWADGLLFPGGVKPELTTNAYAADAYWFKDDGTNRFVGVNGQNYLTEAPPPPPASALTFDGASYATNNASADFSATNLTAEAWIKFTAVFDGYIVTTGNSTAGQWYLGKATYYGDVAFCGAPGTDITGVTALNDDTWHHVAMVVDAALNETRLYVDGVLEATGLYLSPAGSYECGVGATAAGATTFNGSIAEVRLSSIVRYTASFTPASCLGADTNTVAYWQFTEGSGALAADGSGNGHDLTLTGSPLPEWVTGVCTP